MLELARRLVQHGDCRQIAAIPVDGVDAVPPREDEAVAAPVAAARLLGVRQRLGLASVC